MHAFFFMGAMLCLYQFETRDLVEYPSGFFDLCDIQQKPSPVASTQASLRDAWQQTAYRCPRATTLHQRRSALCITRNMNVTIPPHPTPPHPTHQRSTAYRCPRATTLHQRRSALCITRNMNVTIPPHPTPPHPTPPINVALRTDVRVPQHYIDVEVRCASRVTWTLPSHPTPPHPTPRKRDGRGKKCTKRRCAYGKTA